MFEVVHSKSKFHEDRKTNAPRLKHEIEMYLYIHLNLPTKLYENRINYVSSIMLMETFSKYVLIDLKLDINQKNCSILLGNGHTYRYFQEVERR